MSATVKSFPPLHAALLLLPITLAALLMHSMPAASRVAGIPGLTSIATTESAELEAVFESIGYRWPPAASLGAAGESVVPPIAVRAMPVDLHTLPVETRKALFFRALAPLIAAENRALREQRAFLQETFAAYPELPESGPVTSRVRAIASRFNAGGNLDDPRNRALLLRRVDIVPAALVLAQAANESGWGTSRFAREANNLFGMWTWDSSSGISPLRRVKHSRHFVRVFEDLRAAVTNYLHTINVGPAYRELRDLRARQRARGEQPDALTLAAGLTRYSARGEEYVAEIRSIITYNGLHELPPLQLDEDATAIPENAR